MLNTFYMHTFFCHAHFFTHIHLRKLRTILIYIISPQLHFLQLRSKVCFTLCKHYSYKSKETLKLAHRYNSFQALSMCHKHPNSCSCYSYYCKHHSLWDSILPSLALRTCRALVCILWPWSTCCSICLLLCLVYSQ